MAEPLITEIFPGAIASETEITIPKSALSSTGYTPTATNSIESTLVAILLKASEYFTEVRQASNPDQSLVVRRGNPSLVQSGNQILRQDEIVIELTKVELNQNILPGDY